MNFIRKYGIVLRLVEEKDAEFILKLRTNELLNNYISPTSNSITDQINWIKEYKIKESDGLEYYYLAEDSEGERYGTIRLYNFDEMSFEIGSWLFMPKSPLLMAIKTHFIGLEEGFKLFKTDFCRFEIRKLNENVLRYIQDFKTTIIDEDELNYYFILTKENFLIRKKELSYLLQAGK